ncbi:family 16 glycosylhydrolase [Seongchinamella unica]|uniref:family 16 glycosylhydrolase n=1 Tax=Seongchinamella unica TaxID=2547392 RepID=UPI001EEF5230|nr:family 16 glycosylhydrolase [Seongchinamella unica]
MIDLQDADAVVWAINLGGQAHRSIDGIQFQADADGAGATGSVPAVLGAQDITVYRSHRVGEMRLEKSLPDGIYDLTFYFAEPHGAEPGERVFDVLAQDRIVIQHLDVSLSRSSSVPSALKRTVIGVEVTNGRLVVQLRAVRSVPILSGLSVRARQPEAREWRLVWFDEFDYTGPPDASKWQIDQWQAGKVNDEDQAYTSRSRNVRVASGKLMLQAHAEQYQGAAYTSGRVHSKGLGHFLYGRIDISARLPAGQGLWSALWMLPDNPYQYATNCEEGSEWQGNPDCDAWPNSGEIDIMEHVGYDMRRVHSTVHNHRFFSTGPELRNASIEVEDVAGAFHVYSMEWTPQQIRVFVDGVEFYRYLRLTEDWRDWPFDHPFHLIMNLAVGGHWGRAGGPIDQSVFPATMEVDYVRVFVPRAIE